MEPRKVLPHADGTRGSVRILIVDDHQAWRCCVAMMLRDHAGFQVIGEASDGPEAVDKAQQLQPDVILLDVGLPTLNGIVAAQRIQALCPNAAILFLSQTCSWAVAEEALGAGGCGYVVKTDAASELIAAVEAVLRGKCYVSSSLAGGDLGSRETTRRTHASSE